MIITFDMGRIPVLISDSDQWGLGLWDPSKCFVQLYIRPNDISIVHDSDR